MQRSSHGQEANAFFNKANVGDLLRQQDAHLTKEIENIDSTTLVNTNIDDLVQRFSDHSIIEVPQLSLENIQVGNESEVDIDIREDPLYAVSYTRQRTSTKKGTIYSYYLPFTGNGVLFSCKPSKYHGGPFNANRVSVDNGELILEYHRIQTNQTEITHSFDQDKDEIIYRLTQLSKDVLSFNEGLNNKIKTEIEERRKKLRGDQNITASLGYTLRRRSDAQTYTVPISRKKLQASLPPVYTKTQEPEPVLDMAQYEDIIRTISNMAIAMERSPSTFKKLKEEEIRDFFLVMLNAIYEGQATGETFNFGGKTDILIREREKTIFIGECKFWDGPVKFKDTIDQILGYTTWRDTKIAILLFNKNKNFTAVLKTVIDSAMEHPNVKQRQDYTSETGCRFTVRHRDDPDRELILTVLTFDIPTK